ncbi:MAG: energy transducer TonB [Acidobacteriota bacterium]
MGVRLAVDKPAGAERLPTQSGGPHGLGRELGETASSVPQFNLLGPSAEDQKRRWLAMGISPVLEVFVAGFMVWALMALPPKPVTEMAKEEVLYFHAANPPEPAKEPPRLLERPIQPRVAAAPVLPRVRQEKIQKPVIAHLRVPENSQPRIELPKAPPAPTETFTSPKVVRQTPNQQMAIVHTGTFAPTAKANVARLGSFDLPSGPGHGNGTGGAQGVRGTVAGAGFGNAVGESSGGQANRVAPESVRQSDFGSVVAGGKAPRTHSSGQSGAFKPVVILSKPDPVYPAEARRLHIEGQVTLSVLFEASGRLRVLKVVQGLGHGMDAAAIHAAQQIRFKPAERGGRPVDFTAMVHIIFQLAY